MAYLFLPKSCEDLTNYLPFIMLSKIMKHNSFPHGFWTRVLLLYPGLVSVKNLSWMSFLARTGFVHLVKTWLWRKLCICKYWSFYWEPVSRRLRRVRELMGRQSDPVEARWTSRLCV
jgi:hypothetical protein